MSQKIRKSILKRKQLKQSKAKKPQTHQEEDENELEETDYLSIQEKLFCDEKKKQVEALSVIANLSTEFSQESETILCAKTIDRIYYLLSTNCREIRE